MNALSDEIIKKNVEEHIKWDDAVNGENIQVKTENKTVTLTGTVDNYSSKLAAYRDASEVAGGYDIINQLNVKFQPGQQRIEDAEITDNILNVLKWNADVNPVNLQIETENGKVTILGTVTSSREKQEVERIVSSVKGVADVASGIKVKPLSVRTDDFIEKDINRALERSILVDENKVFVEVKNGVVYLSGAVANGAIRNEVEEKALYTNGVIDVVNEITIQ